MSQTTAILSVRREAELQEYSFSYNDWDGSESHSWVASFTGSECQALRDSLQQLYNKPALSTISQVQAHLNQLFPEKLLRSWLDHPPQALVILSDEDSLPWEWVGLGDATLGTLTQCSRDLPGRPNSSAVSHSRPVYGVLGDPVTLPQGVASEVSAVSDLLRQGPGEVVNCASSCTRQIVSEALSGTRFSLVHLAAPGLLPLEVGGQVLSPSDLGGTDRTGPRCVFAHTYLRPEHPTYPLLQSAQAWARKLTDQAVECFLTNIWCGSLSDQRKMVRTVYARLLAGATLGASLQEARRELLSRESPLAFAYVLYGNPSLTLSDFHPMKVRESTTRPGGLTVQYQLRVVEGPEVDRVIPLFSVALAQRGLVLGSAGPRPCDVEFEGLPNQAARLTMQDRALVIENIPGDSQLLSINGLPVRARLALSGWETIALGGHLLKLEYGGALADLQAEQPVHSFCLEIHDGEASTTEWFDEDLLTLGRGSGSRISFSDGAVSRSHAVLQRSGDSLMIGRLGTNVVALNGVPVELPQALSNGDLIQLSDRALIKVLRILD